jgi:hypothetical protein
MNALFLIYFSCFMNVILAVWVLLLRRKLRMQHKAFVDSTRTWRNVVAKLKEAQLGL